MSDEKKRCRAEIARIKNTKDTRCKFEYKVKKQVFRSQLSVFS
jgi:hypothetical protein